MELNLILGRAETAIGVTTMEDEDTGKQFPTLALAPLAKKGKIGAEVPDSSFIDGATVQIIITNHAGLDVFQDAIDFCRKRLSGRTYNF